MWKRILKFLGAGALAGAIGAAAHMQTENPMVNTVSVAIAGVIAAAIDTKKKPADDQD